MTRPLAVIAALAAVLALAASASAKPVSGRLGALPTVRQGRPTLPLVSHGKLRDVRLARGWRIVRGQEALELAGLRIGDTLRVPSNRKRVVVVRRGTVVSFAALNDRLTSTQAAVAQASSALATYDAGNLTRADATNLQTNLNLVDERTLALVGDLAAERTAIAGTAGPALNKNTKLLSAMQSTESAGRQASTQLESASTQLDDALSLVPPGVNLPVQTVSTVPTLAGSALTTLKQYLPLVGNLLQAVLAGG